MRIDTDWRPTTTRRLLVTFAYLIPIAVELIYPFRWYGFAICIAIGCLVAAWSSLSRANVKYKLIVVLFVLALDVIHYHRTHSRFVVDSALFYLLGPVFTYVGLRFIASWQRLELVRAPDARAAEPFRFSIKQLLFVVLAVAVLCAAANGVRLIPPSEVSSAWTWINLLLFSAGFALASIYACWFMLRAQTFLAALGWIGLCLSLEVFGVAFLMHRAEFIEFSWRWLILAPLKEFGCVVSLELPALILLRIEGFRFRATKLETTTVEPEIVA
jgi:hypothetical protein